jgi:hypothetical protein
MALISEEYRRMQEELHRNPNYGVASVQYAPMVAEVLQQVGATELLDYGAGKGRLGETLKTLMPDPPQIRHYDPARPEWAVTPQPAPFVACIDVLEHIEPDLLDNVLDDLHRVTAGHGFFTVHTGPAVKMSPCRSRRAPSAFPVGRIYCVGRNYAEHAREMGHDPDREPPFFLHEAGRCHRARWGDDSLSPDHEGSAPRNRDGGGDRQGRRRHPRREGAGSCLRLRRRPRHDPARYPGRGEEDGPSVGDGQGIRQLGAVHRN